MDGGSVIPGTERRAPGCLPLVHVQPAAGGLARLVEVALLASLLAKSGSGGEKKALTSKLSIMGLLGSLVGGFGEPLVVQLVASWCSRWRNQSYTRQEP